MQLPAPANLRITYASQSRAEPPRTRGRAFQFTGEKARASPDVAISMFISLILLIMFCVMLMLVPLLGMFLVESFPALVLFESGAIRPFVSRSFNREFDILIGELECPFLVSIANEHGVLRFQYIRVVF